MKKFAGLLLALMLGACLYAQKAAGGDKSDVVEIGWNNGDVMFGEMGRKTEEGHEIITIVTMDPDYMLCAVGGIADNGGGDYTVTFLLSNGYGHSSKKSMVLYKGAVVHTCIGFVIGDCETAYGIFKTGETVVERTMYVKDIGKGGFIISDIKPE